MSITPLQRESEPYSRYGNISAEGIQRLLGTPHLDALQILIRETVQNAWDAGKDLPGSVRYLLRLRYLTESQLEFMKTMIFGDLPSYSTTADTTISQVLETERLAVIEICDFGTTGLGGPTRSDEVPRPDQSPDFVDFFRNIGSPRDKVFGGGTYGYGKSSLYAFSKCQTIIVDSVAKDSGEFSRRFMACRVASRYDVISGSEKGRYTGRHWWGRKSADSYLDPLTGPEALEFSKSLGMYEREEGELGTSILIPAPRLNSSDLQEVAKTAIQALLWFCWPKIVKQADSSHPPMVFEVEVDGERIPIPRPESCSPLNLLSDSLQSVRKHVDSCDSIECQRPKKHLGLMHVSRNLRQERPEILNGEDSLIPSHLSHVALMRPAELVVKYLVGEKLPSEGVEWGGVFICSSEHEVEQAFARSEPPAHDDWNPESLPKGRMKTFVRVALSRIRTKIMQVTAESYGAPEEYGGRRPLGKTADLLGTLLGGGPGQRLGARRGARGPTGPRKPVVLGKPVFIGHAKTGGKNCAMFSVDLRCSQPVEIRVSGSAKIIKDGGGVDETDPRGDAARVLAWKIREEVTHGSEITITSGSVEKLIAVVQFPEGKAISFNATYEALS